jgi:Family of unknown function (DUF5684)
MILGEDNSSRTVGRRSRAGLSGQSRIPDKGEQAMEVILILLWIAVSVLMIASVWVVYTKAGQPGWASLIPIYNIIVMLQIAGKPTWWILLCLIPIVNIVIMFMMYIAVARAFGKSDGFGIGLIFLSFIFFPILAFGDAKYVGAAQPAAVQQ